MKKIFAFLAAFILLTGCDDGDMTFRTFNFDDDDPETCDEESGVFYKINDSEVLIFELDYDTNLVNIPTETGAPRTVEGVVLTYRNYSGDVSLSSTLCSTIPPASPTVIEEWIGEGQFEIVTTPVYDSVDDDVDHVTGYNHQITLRTGTFAKDGEEITITNVSLGTIRRDLGFDFDFESDPETPTVLAPCDNNVNTLYTATGSEALVLTLEDEYINATTTLQIDLDDPGDNSLLLRVFSSSPGEENICGPNPPISPVEEQRWVAAEGIIEIEVVQDGSSYIHTVHLKNVVFDDQESQATYEVLPADDYIIGTFTTN
jgi:hypothetical protein